jgi:hypothetical protein
MKIKKIATIGVGVIFIFICVSSLYADETSDLILKLLIKKGIITQQEVNELKAEVAKEKPPVPASLEKRVAELERQQKEELPAWVKNLKLKGDLRLRNEYIDNDRGKDRNRQRIRFRVGAKSKINEQLKIGFGLASGSSDTPTSTNQTLEQEFQSKNIWLDYAYARYEPAEWLQLIGGKFKSPFFHTDMLWDSDIRFDGFAAKLSHKLLQESDMPTKIFLTTGYFPIDERSTSARDVYLAATQVGSETKFPTGLKLKTGIAYYDFHSLEGYPTSSLAEEAGTNSTTVWGTIENDYRVISPTLKLSSPTFFGLIDIPCGLLSEFAHNSGASNDNKAWRVGFWLGKIKVKKKREWKLLGQYTRLEKDAFFDAFPDSDFNNAGTNGKGWELIFDYGLADNVVLSVDYYNTDSITGSSAEQQILQTDVIFKF